MTRLIGLTGSIGTGKTTVSNFLNQAAVPIIDADQISHELQKVGTECYDQIVATFGNKVAGSNAIDRAKLGQIVFNAPDKLKRLNRLMDSFIRQSIVDEIVTLERQAAELIVLDAPLLFEAGYASYVDEVIFVACDSIEQVQRIKKRNHVSTAQAVKLIGNQWPQAVKRILADRIINNSGSISQTKRQVLKLLDNLR